MKINDFKSEVFFDQYEFNAKYLLSLSDAESMSVEELLSYEPGATEEFLKIRLGYTEVPGSPELRREIAKLYHTVNIDQISVHCGAEEPIFNFMWSMLEPGDHVVCMFPAYQSLYDVAAGAGAEVSRWHIRPSSTIGEWMIDLEELKSLIRPNTKLICINSPNNPTGFVFTDEQINEIVEIAKANDLYLYSDEVYHGLELDGQKRQLLVDLYDKAISMNVMSKAYGMAGLRIGWIATKDKYAYERITKAKHYTTVCNAAPSEFLATLALKHGEKIIDRNMKILRDNLDIADRFFAKYPDLFDYARPKAATVAFFKMNIKQQIDEFCIDMVRNGSIIVLSADIYDMEGQYIRIGFGRKNFAECLGKFEDYLREIGIVK
ncbi:MAG: aminotransferase class I/II-fold pyridoxal phosphate-dependent enzyme [Eubacteriales bacterium]